MSCRTLQHFFTAAAFLAGGALFLITVLQWHKKDTARIRALTDYLEKVNTGSGGITLQAREAALKAQRNFADNLQELFAQAEVAVQIPEAGEIVVLADME